MFRKEIKFIYDFNLNKVRKLGAYLTYEQIKKAKIHPAILHYISAEIDFLIFEDRQKILKDSIFDYSGEKVSNLFYQISDEVKKNKRFSIEYIAQLILHSASFTVNYLARPRWALMKLIFEDDEHKGTTEIKQILNYVFYYSYLNKIITSYINRKKILSLNYDEFEELLNKIDDLGFQSDMQGILDSALKSMADFFNMGEPHKHLIPIQSVELFLREKNLTPHLLKLREAFPHEDKLIYDIKDYQKVFSSLTKEELDELKQHDAAELDESAKEEPDSTSADEYNSGMKIKMAEDEETIEEPITAPVSEESDIVSEEEPNIEEQAEEEETELEIDEDETAQQEAESSFAKTAPAGKSENESGMDTTENENHEDETEPEHVVDETKDLPEVNKDEHEEVIEYNSCEGETPDEDNILKDVEEQNEQITDEEDTTTLSLDDQQTEEAEDENIEDVEAENTTSPGGVDIEASYDESDLTEEDNTDEEEIKDESAHVIEDKSEEKEFEEDVVEMDEEEIENKDSIDEFEDDEEEITETPDVKPNPKSEPSFAKTASAGKPEEESTIDNEMNSEVEEDKNEIRENPGPLPEKDEDTLSLFGEMNEEIIDTEEESADAVEPVDEKPVDESTSQEDTNKDILSENVIEEPKDDKNEEETLTDTETELISEQEPEIEYKIENEIASKNEEEPGTETKSDVVEDYEDFSDIIEDHPVVETPEEPEEEEDVSESETIKIEMSELLERKNMTKVIEVIFDYDIEEFANVIDSSCKYASKTEATEYLDGYFRSNHISTTSKEAETLKSVISEYFDHKTK